MKVIGIAGLARSGKDLFATVATDILKKEYKMKVDRYALAYELKNDLKGLVFKKTGIDVFTEKTEEKNIIRPLLVAYGDMMRQTSEGKYWTKKVEYKIVKSKADVCFVTDIRYDMYPEDEVYWVQNRMAGNLVHITRYKFGPAPSKRYITTSKPVKIYDGAPNDHELLNSPKVKRKADCAFEWEDVSNICPTAELLRASPYIVDHVRYLLKKIKVII